MDAIEHQDDDDKKAGAAKANGRAIAMRALGVAGLVAAMGAAAVGGAVVAVGQERLLERVAALTAKDDNAHQPDAAGLAHVPLPETVYTLSSGTGTHYLMAKITLRIDQRDENAVRANLPALQTVLQTFMRELTVDELTGAAGLYQLRKACLHRARKVMGDQAVKDVFITEIMVQ